MKIFLLAVPYDSGYYNIKLGAGPIMLQNGLALDLSHQKHDVRKATFS